MGDEQGNRGLPRAIFDASLDGIFVIDLDGRYVDVNPSGCRMFGYTREELLANDVTLLIFPEDREEALARDREGWEKGLTLPRYRLRRKDGSEVWVSMTIAPLTVDGRPLALGIKRDISDAIRVEDARRESEERYRTAIEHTNDGVAIIRGLRHIFVNRKYAELFGYDDPAEMLDVPLTDLTHPDDMERVAALSRAREGEGDMVSTYECRGLRRDGSVVHVEVSAARVTHDGEPASLGFLRDITSRREAEQALQESENKYRTVVENAGEIITVIQDGIIQFVNTRGAEFTGRAVDDIVGRPITDMIAEEDREMVVGQHRKRLAGEPVAAYSYRVKDAEGNLKWIEMTGVLVEWNGRPATVNFLADISERKRLEEQLRHSQRMEAVGRLAGGIAHDFNNLLTAITGYGSLLETELEEGDPRREEVQEILRASDRATELTDQLLVFSRRKVSTPKLTDLNHLVGGMENMLRRLLGENVTLETRFHPDLESIKVDSVQMEQVLMNLVVNAREAMPGGGRISLRTENVVLDDEQCLNSAEARPGRFVRLVVEDSGTGLSPEVIEHMFEPFFSTRDSGSGLGLSLVYGIVTQHDGWVEVDSTPGEGTVFSIFLPRFSETPAIEPAKPKTLNGLQGKGERILLVEDEEGVRRYATRVLSGNGYTVFSAASTGEALKIYDEERGRFDLVFSDQVLPGRNGLELVEMLREADPKIGVLLTSGYAGKESSRKKIEEKGYPFLRKPYGTSDVLIRIRRVLDGED